MATNIQPIVQVKDFNLVLGGKPIVSNVSFEVQPGEIFALLGANGSGKTSTIRTLLDIYQPTSGKLLINGVRYTPEHSNMVGYLPEERGLYVRSTVINVMTYFGELKGMARSDAHDFSMEFLERVGLADKAKLKIKKLSGGQQQKVQLGVAIINNPKLLILDEPTKGLDPINRKLLLEIVEEYQDKGTAVIYITHMMEEVERLADRVLIIKDGVRKAYGSKDELKKSFDMKSIEDIFVSIYEEKSDV
ncbi:MAG TPA: ATP-binding cassette domain-containing protein [Candidatus Saccharimonadales bacterium]|jgi:ABC-2 type transport system ATP-binding protein